MIWRYKPSVSFETFSLRSWWRLKALTCIHFPFLIVLAFYRLVRLRGWFGLLLCACTNHPQTARTNSLFSVKGGVCVCVCVRACVRACVCVCVYCTGVVLLQYHFAVNAIPVSFWSPYCTNIIFLSILYRYRFAVDIEPVPFCSPYCTSIILFSIM